MDIWAWVSDRYEQLKENKQDRLADLIYEIPEASSDDRHDEVERLLPEALHLCRSVKDKELELFFRHWRLQSQVLMKNNVKGLIDESIALLDFSHQDDLKHCPQRVCAVQDLAAAYGIKDGPGFVDERIAVCEEIYSQIDPSWPCFECITQEHVKALLDDKQYSQALSFAQQQQNKRLAHGQGALESDSAIIFSYALIKNNKLHEAFTLLKNAKGDNRGTSFDRSKAILLSLIYALQKDYESALKHLPKYETILLAQSYFTGWVEVIEILVKNNAFPFDQDLVVKLHRLAHLLQENGATRKSIDINNVIIDLSIRNSFIASATVAIERVESLTPLLQKDLGVTKRNQEHKKSIELKAAKLSKSKTQRNYSEEEFDNLSLEHQFKWCQQVLVNDDSENTVTASIRLANCYARYYFPQKGCAHLKEVFDRQINLPNILFEYGKYLINNMGDKALIEVFSELKKENLSVASQLDYFYLMGVAHEDQDISQSIEFYKLGLELSSHSEFLKERLARAYMNSGSYQMAQAEYEELIKLAPQNKDYHWELITSASIPGEWEKVRASSQEIGFTFSSENGEIKENWERVLIDVSSLPGKETTLLAQRTGPVTAKITEISELNQIQYYGREVVFSPTPLNSLDQTDDEGYKHDKEGNYCRIYKYIESRSLPEYFAFAIDGFHPGEEALEILINEITNLDAVVSVRSGNSYQLRWDASNEHSDALGIYAYVLINTTNKTSKEIEIQLGMVDDLLEKFTKDFEKPLIWPLLLEAIRDKEKLRSQVAIEQKYEM